MLPRLLTDAAYRARVVPRVADPPTHAFFVNQFENWRDSFRELNKVEAFLFSPEIRKIAGRATSTLHLEHALARDRIVIANLAKGRIGETNAHLIGALLLARTQAADMARARIAEHKRRNFHIVLGAAQSFGTLLLPRRQRRCHALAPRFNRHTGRTIPTRCRNLNTATRAHRAERSCGGCREEAQPPSLCSEVGARRAAA